MPSLLPTEFRDLWSGPARRFFACTLLSAIGNGMILSFAVVYVHDVRHQSTLFAECLLVGTAIGGLCTAPLAGTLTDRFGPAYLMITGMLVAGCGIGLYAEATTPWGIVSAVAVMVVGQAGGWGPGTVLLTRLVTPAQRQRAYGFNFMLLNLGIGLGLAVNAIFVNLSDASTFTNLYLANAGLTVCCVPVIVSLVRFGRALPASERARHDASVGEWREVLADRRLRHYMIAAFILLLSGYMSLDAGFSLFVTNVVHLSVHFIGIAFIFNTLTIVIGQHFALRFIQGKSRSRIMGVVGLLWAVSWLLIALTNVLPHALSLVVLCVSFSVFALGEIRWMPVSSALVNDIAPERLRGRYNAASGAVWSLTGAVAPLLAVWIMDSRVARLWPLIVAGGALLGGLYATTLRHSLTAHEDGRDVVAEPVAGAPTPTP
jgi:MFS family permease